MSDRARDWQAMETLIAECTAPISIGDMRDPSRVYNERICKMLAAILRKLHEGIRNG